MVKYGLVLRTAEAEIKAISNVSSEIQNNIRPIIELTRSRRTAKDKKGDIQKNIEKIKKIFTNKELIFDLTSEKSLSNEDIRELFIPDGGYDKWLCFLDSLSRDLVTCTLSPTILFNFEDDEADKNIGLQIKRLWDNFNSITYRCDIEIGKDLEGDLDLLVSNISENASKKIIFVLDFGKVCPGEISSFSSEAVYILTNSYDKLKRFNVEFILVGNSFPDTSEMSTIGVGREIIPLYFIKLYEEIKKKLSGPILNLLTYADYGTINQKRNDDVIMTRGWVPRVDFPTSNEIIIRKDRRASNKKGAYSLTYASICRSMQNDPDYIANKIDCWGNDQITSAASGLSPGATPSFWISVRMNIHIHQQLERLNSEL